MKLQLQVLHGEWFFVNKNKINSEKCWTRGTRTQIQFLGVIPKDSTRPRLVLDTLRLVLDSYSKSWTRYSTRVQSASRPPTNPLAGQPVDWPRFAWSIEKYSNFPLKNQRKMHLNLNTSFWSSFGNKVSKRCAKGAAKGATCPWH